MFQLSKRELTMHRKRQGGYTLIQLFLTMTILIFLVGSSVGLTVALSKQRENSEIQANISQLESVLRSYYYVNNTLPNKAKNLSDFHKTSTQGKFFNAFLDEGTLTGTEVNARFKLIDTGKLITESYLSSAIDDADNYIVDTKTIKVNYVGELGKDVNYTSLAKDLIESGGDVFKLKRAGDTDLKDGTKTMTEVKTSVAVGDYVIVGGKGTMAVALVNIERTETSVKGKVTDLTTKLESAPTSVTGLRYLGDSNILVHYYDGTKLKFETISFED